MRTEEKVIYGMVKVDYNRALILPFNKAVELYKLILEATPVTIAGYSTGNITNVLEEDTEFSLTAITEKKYKEQVFSLILENDAK